MQFRLQYCGPGRDQRFAVEPYFLTITAESWIYQKTSINYVFSIAVKRSVFRIHVEEQVSKIDIWIWVTNRSRAAGTTVFGFSWTRELPFK
jgi:hypothetical protein